ncbi:hypothetical protein A4A58_18675 [Tardiphaga robiniae]|uniref:Uncharacterized protein n=1 Tax=Tardiphaga robiniae TaxID=943830 RepID=A0A163XD26_9BRAD|nr:hypothetical protein A4A58_18675 [Tardiphaga robiniae]
MLIWLIPPLLFFLVGATVALLATKQAEPLVRWTIIGISSAILLTFFVLVKTNYGPYRAVSDGLYVWAGPHHVGLAFAFAIFYRLMTDGCAALLVGCIVGTLNSTLRQRQSPDHRDTRSGVD